MATLTLTVKPRLKKPATMLVEIDADQFERLAASLGLFNPDFLKSIARAEHDYRAGRTRKIRSFKELRA